VVAQATGKQKNSASELRRPRVPTAERLHQQVDENSSGSSPFGGTYNVQEPDAKTTSTFDKTGGSFGETTASSDEQRQCYGEINRPKEQLSFELTFLNACMQSENL